MSGRGKNVAVVRVMGIFNPTYTSSISRAKKRLWCYSGSFRKGGGSKGHEKKKRMDEC
ncbi:hypothetical protein DY000_02004870 [Brassica cretica]|uniref:Uncharacterized protein n=1 Tax=Brassica cretica TaxID=69181 RepID=A0ABQ7CAB6_BRACR|nr:hypothetical protein DY000_02040871 [Brassica cretica]KAF3548651.1 hypothetical protein DY000_02004870 [Brassica cretica]